MIIPSFNNFAATPDYGGAFVGGAGVGQRAVQAQMESQAAMARIAAERSIAAQNNATRQQELAQEMQLKQQALQQDALQKSQEMEIEKFYKESILGLQQQKIQGEINEFNLKAQESADKYIAVQNMRKFIEEAISNPDPTKRKTVPEAFAEGMARFGPGFDAPGSAYSDIIQQRKAEVPLDPEIRKVPGEAGEQGWRYGQTGHGSQQFFPPEKFEPPRTNAPPGYILSGDRILPERDPVELKELKKKRDRVADFLDSKDAQPGKMAMAKKANGGELRKGEELLMNEYLAKQRELAELENKITKFAPATSSGSSTNRVRRYNPQTRKFE